VLVLFQADRGSASMTYCPSSDTDVLHYIFSLL